MTAEEFSTIDDRKCIESLTDEEILLIVKQPERSEAVDETEKIVMMYLQNQSLLKNLLTQYSHFLTIECMMIKKCVKLTN